MSRSGSGWWCALVVLSACQYSGPPLCRDQDCLQPAPDAGGAVCHKDPDCPLATICDGTRCVSGCRSNHDCPAGKICDTNHVPYGTCVKINIDAAPPPDAPWPDAPPPPIDAGCTDQWIPLLGNGNFDQGPGHGWTEHVTQGEPLVTTAPTGVTTHSGSYLLWLGGIDNNTETITQTVVIPTDATQVKVSGWYRISSGTGQADMLTLGILDFPIGRTFTDSDATGTWTSFQKTAAVTMPSQTGSHTFSASSTTQLGSGSFYFDDLDVSALVCR